MTTLVACVDVGSTFTKAALVDTADGGLVGTAASPTTIGTDVLQGVDACLQQLRSDAGLAAATALDVLACSSAGGGLRLAVVGYERAVTAEAGHRVGLSAGARVAHVTVGPLDGAGVKELLAGRPDVVLLVGGTDGGNSEVLLHNAARLASSRLRAPVVVGGNVDARGEVQALLQARGKTVIPTANVLPEIGRLDPLPARQAIREVFIRHVIGGKGLSRGPRFPRMVRAATPDVVLAGVELLADGCASSPDDHGRRHVRSEHQAGVAEPDDEGGFDGNDPRGAIGVGDVVVIDIGGATTDVYSVVTPTQTDEPWGEVAGTLWRSRTVEGDLGMRWNAPGVVAAAEAERLVAEAELGALTAAAAVRAADPGYLPASAAERELDVRLASLAVTVALRRHARGSGKSLRHVRLVVGSGGVLRYAAAGDRARVLAPATSDFAGGWAVPERAAVTVDERYVLAAAGLLRDEHPCAAWSLLERTLAPDLPAAGVTTP